MSTTLIYAIGTPIAKKFGWDVIIVGIVSK
jgi:hypothetical protein